MTNWYYTVTNDLTQLPKCIAYYESELISARAELKIKGSIESIARTLPGIFEQRFSQLQVIEAMLEHFNIDLRQLRSEKFKKFIEHYNKTMSSRDAEKYVDGDADVVTLQKLINEIALLRNYWLAVIKGLDNLSFSVSNIVKLRCAGLDDANLN